MSFKGPDARQEKLLWQAAALLALLFIVAVGVGIGWVVLQVLNLLDDILIPVTIALILAYLLHPLVNLLEKLRLKRSLAVLLLFALVGGSFAAVSIILAPKLYLEAKLLFHSLPDWEGRIGTKLDRFLQDNSSLGVPLNHVTDMANAHLKEIGTQLASMSGLNRLLHTVGFALGLVFVPFYLFYFLADQPKIEGVWKNYIPLHDSTIRSEIVVIVEQINKYLVSFFRGQIVVAAIDGILITIGLAAIGVNYALLIGAAACLLTIIPYFGILTVCLVTFLVAGFQGDGGGPHLVALSLAVFAAVQTLENIVISPRVMNQRTGLHPVTVLLSILIWSSLLGGLLGAILAVPLTATLKVLMARYALIKGNAGDDAKPHRTKSE